jgi:hypothetical protein
MVRDEPLWIRSSPSDSELSGLVHSKLGVRQAGQVDGLLKLHFAKGVHGVTGNLSTATGGVSSTPFCL